jgi:uncharacterized protein
VALNCFDGAPTYEIDEIREALAIGEHVPVVMADARQRESVKQTLITVVEYTLSHLRAVRSGVRAGA